MWVPWNKYKDAITPIGQGGNRDENGAPRGYQKL